MNYLDLIQPWENEADVETEWLFERIRLWRSRELSASDWTQLTDSSANKTEWANYRQALRDLPASNKDPKKIVFPTRPEA
jgi:hypothetical protein